MPSSTLKTPEYSAVMLAYHLRRVMAQEGWTYDDVVNATGLDARTVRSIAQSNQTPQAKTLHKLAAGLGVDVEELIAPVEQTAASFDAATNTALDTVLVESPEVFVNWSRDDFAELASRFGIGGALSETGVLRAAEAMNRKRETLSKAKLLLESKHATTLTDLVDALYQSALAKESLPKDSET